MFLDTHNISRALGVSRIEWPTRDPYARQEYIVVWAVRVMQSEARAWLAAQKDEGG